MPKIAGSVMVDDILDALDLPGIPAGCRYSLNDRIDFDDVHVSQDDIDDEASEQEPEQIEVDTASLREGIRALLMGDHSIGSILHHRALDGHDDAQRAVEEEIRWSRERSAGSFQARVQPWLMACFGPMIAGDREERNHRFLEEAIELVQACGCTADEAHQLVDYTFSRPVGDPHQEVGGVMVTLAALCLARELNMHWAGEAELARIWTKVDAIRAKQAAKPQFGPLPA